MNSYQPDIFISYTHNDNLPPGEGQKGWVELFHHSLLVLIHQLYENDVNIWRDPKTHGNDKIKSDVSENVRAANLLVAILSPKYLASRWCLRELRWFMKSFNREDLWSTSAKSPIFKVSKTRTEFKKQPEVIRGTTGYDFYHYDETTEYIEHFKQVEGFYDVRYWNTLDRLAQDIVRTLKTAVAKHGKPLPSTPPEKVVYLAEPTSDLQGEHKRIKDELKMRHYQVLPEEPLFAGSTQLRGLVRDYLKRSRASIHLVGKSYLELPESERQHSLVRLQNNLAAERLLGSDFSRFIWVPDEVPLTDLQQMELVGHRDQNWLKGTEFLQSSLDELRAVMLEKLENRRHNPPVGTRSSRKTIYLIYDKQDRAEIDAIHDCLFRQGYEVTTPSFEEDVKSVERHKSKLATCDAVLIYYGRGSQDWIETHLDYLDTVRGIKSIDQNESGIWKPLLAKAVYVSPPFAGHKRIFNTWRATVLKTDEAFDCEHLRSFFEHLEERPETHRGNN